MPTHRQITAKDEAQISALVDLYESKRKLKIKPWLEEVRNHIQALMGLDNARIHYIRWRLKDPQHLREKLRRKWPKYQKLGLNEDNFFDKVTDLAGLRILVLYRDDIPLVDEQVRTDSHWTVKESVAYCDEGRRADQLFFEEHGFIPAKLAKAHEARLETVPRGYSSVHYILQKKDRAQPCETCELQLRTIHQEAWGEFDHELKYPRGNVDPLASELIAKLSSLLNLAEDIVREIRRHPTSALIFQHLLSRAWRTHDTTLEGAQQQLTSVFLPNSPFLYRSAPIAAFDILRSDRSDGPQDRLVSLDFGSVEDWGAPNSLIDPLRELYVNAHAQWKRNSTTRSVRKYVLLNGKRALPKKLISGCEELEFYAIDRQLFKDIHLLLAQRHPNLFLQRTQFFLWDTEGVPQSAQLARGNKVYGFHSPARTSDLTSGIVWLDDLKDWYYRRVKAYAKLLDILTEKGLIHNARLKPTNLMKHQPQRNEAIASSIEEAFNGVF